MMAETRDAPLHDDSEARIAILVIHGMGQQNPLQTIDQFARGLLPALNDRFVPEGATRYLVVHDQVERSLPQNPEVWLENFVTLMGPRGTPTIDVYENYWAHRMTDQATVRDVVAWLKDISRAAREFYDAQPRATLQGHFDQRYREEPRLRNMFEPTGRFHKNGYLRHLDILVRIGLRAMALVELSVLRRWPILQALFDAILGWLKKKLLDYIGDVVVCSPSALMGQIEVIG